MMIAQQVEHIMQTASVVGAVALGGLVGLGSLYILFRVFQRGMEDDVVNIVARVLIEHQLSDKSHPDIRSQLNYVGGSVKRIEAQLEGFITKLDERIMGLPCLDPRQKTFDEVHRKEE